MVRVIGRTLSPTPGEHGYDEGDKTDLHPAHETSLSMTRMVVAGTPAIVPWYSRAWNVDERSAHGAPRTPRDTPVDPLSPPRRTADDRAPRRPGGSGPWLRR
jgi:hypothetical protein